MKNTLCIILFVFLNAFILSSQRSEFIPEKKLKKDFKQILKLLDAHPDPYRHITEEGYDELVKEVRNELNKPMTVMGFYKKVAPLVSIIKDGHTSISLPYLWMKKYSKEKGVFPYKTHLTDENELYVLSHYLNEESIPKGAKILSINGLSIEEFIAVIDPYISYERIPFRNAIIEEAIHTYLYLAFGEEDIILTYLSDKTHKEKVQFIAYDDYKDSVKKDRAEREDRIAKGRPYLYKKITDDIGMLSIYSFSVGDFSKYEFFLRETFKTIAKEKISSLILDVRGNYGGYPKVSAELFHHLSNKYFKTMAKSETKISQPYRDHFVEAFGGINSRKYHFLKSSYSIDLDAVLNGEIGSYSVESAIYNEPPEVKNKEFSGDLYLLTDRRSYSASSSFAATFRCYGFGKIIGSETGGTSVFHANAMYDKLKHSKLGLAIATAKKYTTCYNVDDQGIVPDVPYKPSVLDLVSGRDTHLNYLLFIIKKYKRKAEKAETTTIAKS